MFITNAKWVSEGGKVLTGVIEVANGRLFLHEGVCSAPELPDDPELLFNSRSHLILPGFIDSHVHFREPGQIVKEGIINGSKAALAGGVTTVLDMPNNKPPCSTLGRLSLKRATFQWKCLTNWGIHFQARSPARQVPNEPYASAKLYMAKSSDEDSIHRVDAVNHILSRFPRVCVHAEDDSVFPPAAGKEPLPHHVARPREAVSSALQTLRDALRKLPKKHRPRVILCHVATSNEVEWVRRMKNDGFDVWAETCPHYLFLTQDDYLRRGDMLKVNPPLREESDRQAVLEALRDGTIDLLSTDHAPHLPAEKARKGKAPSGIASIEVLAPLAMLLVDRGELSLPRLLDVTSKNPSRCFGLEGRDGIKNGNWADLTILSTTSGGLCHPEVVTKAKIHPYIEYPFTRCVTATVVSGVLKYVDGKFPSSEPGKEAVS